MKVLVVAAHPDDEVLGCGGTIAWHAERGHDVKVLILAEGVTSRQVKPTGGNAKALSNLAKSARRANKLLGVEQVELLGFPDNRMDSLARLDIIQTVENRVASWKPEVVYTHHAGDLNIDHQITHEAVITACRPSPGQCVTTVLCFEVPSSTEWRMAGVAQDFHANWFVDITRFLELKSRALHEYADEMRPWPHPRSIQATEHLARWRGASTGVDAAEAFMLAHLLQRSAHGP